MLAGILAAATALAPAPGADEAAWERTLERVVPAVVVLRVSATRPFDTERTGTSTATGFVVDAERGIILTNRHVVGPGPVVAEAVFQNHEEVDVHAIYRDPVHDFGFFQYDPADVRFMPPAELELAPERARVGVEIRVVGNDAGEKLSILAGTLARLDRAAPRYGRGRYNDFNTFYLQAASGTSGGSSGSPVVDRSGRVVALNAGGKTRAASSYYLPLDRVVRALELLREGQPVVRGTVQAVFAHQPYDELRRLGLRPETEGLARNESPDAIGMLTVAQTVPGGPADDVLRPGDVLVRVEGRLVTDFLPLESELDRRVGGTITLDLERGGDPQSVQVPVADLHAVTPDRYLEVGGGVLNPLSYQQARNYALPTGGVYVSSSGYMLRHAGIPRGSVITEVAGEPTPDLETLQAALAARADGARVPIRYFRVQTPRNAQVSVATVDRRWHPMRLCRRDDATGGWPCEAAPDPPPAATRGPTTARLPDGGDRRTRRAARSLALVRFQIPYRVDGVHGDSFLGTGVVIDAEKGLVLVDRDTVPVALGDATLTFAGSLEVPGEVVLLHPEHNLAVVRYDPSLVGETPIESARFHVKDLAPGDGLRLVALTPSQQLLSEDTQISRVDAAALGLTSPPRFRERNVALLTLTRMPTTLGGVLVDRWGRILALWASFASDGDDGPESVFAGIPSEILLDVVEPLRAGVPFEWRSIGAELAALPLADARNRGLSEAAARRLEEHDSEARRALVVARLAADVPAAELLEEGDLLLAADGRTVTRVREVERAIQREAVTLTLLRDGEELDVRVATQPLSARGTARALVWSGALLQVPHRAVAVERAIAREGVYVAWFFWGSPAHRYGLSATRRIVEVDGQPTPDLDAFLAAVAAKPDRGSVRMQTVDLDGKVEVITLKLDLRYWPAYELRMTDAGWVREAR